MTMKTTFKKGIRETLPKKMDKYKEVSPEEGLDMLINGIPRRIKMKKDEDKYLAFELALKEQSILFQKEVMVKDLFPTPTHFKHKFRVDYLIITNSKPDKFVVEIEGGSYNNGRHTRPVGFVNDMLKYNAIQVAGYPVLRFTAAMISVHPRKVAIFIKQYIDNCISVVYLSEFTENFKLK
jgi:very-short-patch-repair endonuclease